MFLKASYLMIITYLQVTGKSIFGWSGAGGYCYGSRWHFDI